MQDPATLSKPQLLQLVGEKNDKLASKDNELASHSRTIARQSDIIRQLESKLEDAAKQYARLWQERFAAKSERYIADPDQLRMDFGDTPESADAAAGLADAIEEADLIPAHRRKKRKKRDESLPDHLPREVIIVEPDEAAKICALHGEKNLLPESMWDVREKLIYIPGSFTVEVRKYVKYACLDEPACGITSAERPTGIVEGDKYDSSVASQILVSKFAYHQPIYRQQDMFAGTGWIPSRSTMLNILTQCFFIIGPLLEYFKKVVQGDSVVSCDDTGVTLLYPKIPPDFDLADPKQRRMQEVFTEALAENKPSIRAKMWAYRGERVKLNVFDFTVSRHRDGPDAFFENHTGTILGDCWHGFGAIAAESNGEIVRAACNAHARRKFEDAMDYPADRRKWMGWYTELYDINTREQNLSSEEKLKLRQSEARSIWDQMRGELDSVGDRTEQVVLPKSDFRKALNYLANHWTELTRYLDDVEVPIDNNQCEQLMKQIGLGRKNWLFCGSVAGGERNAGFMTLVSSAHRNDLDVWGYVNDVLKRLLAGQTDYEPMLPWNWGAAHPDSIRQFRQEERRERHEQKQFNRDQRRARKRLQKKLDSHRK